MISFFFWIVKKEAYIRQAIIICDSVLSLNKDLLLVGERGIGDFRILKLEEVRTLFRVKR